MQNFEEKVLPELMKEVATITGQKPAVRSARKSIAGFKIREGSPVGLQVTLRGKRMNAFLLKLTAVVLPRVRDFRGINLTNIDTAGNLNIGIRDYLVFPEISAEQSRIPLGIQVTLVPERTKGRDDAIALYRSLGIPLKN